MPTLHKRKGNRKNGTGLAGVLGTTKPDPEVAVPRVIAAAVRAAKILWIVIVPGPAPQNPCILISVIPARTPFPHIARHVLTPIRALALWIATYRRSPVTGLSHGERAAAAIKPLSPGIFPPIGASRHLFPFLLRG